MTTTPTRVQRLPVRLDAADFAIQLFVGDRKVASAWGPLVDDPDAWVLWNGYNEPYRISGGRAAALTLVKDRSGEWHRREHSLWNPSHGEISSGGFIAMTPGGVVCVTCGLAIGVTAGVGTVWRGFADEITVHYACDDCLASEPDDEPDDLEPAVTTSA